jgi:CarD family transcriptional regulator, regulator of rRNA transcription
MAQRMAPTKVGSKKAATKPPIRKDAAVTAGAKATKTKPKAAPLKSHAKTTVKAAPVKPAPAKHAPHKAAATHAVAKAPAPAPAHAKSAAQKTPVQKTPVQKVPAKEALKAAAKMHAAAKREASKPAAAAHAGKPAAKPAMMPPPPARPAAATGAPRAMPAAVAKVAGQKISTPAPGPAAPVATPAAAEAAAAAKAAAAAAAGPKKPVSQRHGFKISEWIVYPAHGVGRIVGIEEQEIAGIALELFVITFEKDKMTLRVPTGKSESVGMRKLAEEPTVKKAMETLKGRARVKRTMWSRRAQEYEAKINSGDLIAIAEVVRDLYRSESQPEQSYSERQLYEAALDRMAREIAAVEKLDERGAVQRITEVLAKSARGRRIASDEAEEEKAA